MIHLNKYGNIEIDGNIFDKQDLVGLYRLQKQLLIEENIVATLEECIEIWSGYSNDLSASWLDTPKDDESILRRIKGNSCFVSFEHYINSQS